MLSHINEFKNHWFTKGGTNIQEKPKLHSIDEYIAHCREEIQPKLQTLRKIIMEAEPQLTERLSWQMPTFYLKGNVIHFASNKKHIGLYCGAKAVNKFKDRLIVYKTSNGTIQIPNEMELDEELIKDIVRFNVELNLKE